MTTKTTTLNVTIDIMGHELDVILDDVPADPSLLEAIRHGTRLMAQKTVMEELALSGAINPDKMVDFLESYAVTVLALTHFSEHIYDLAFPRFGEARTIAALGRMSARVIERMIRDVDHIATTNTIDLRDVSVEPSC